MTMTRVNDEYPSPCPPPPPPCPLLLPRVAKLFVQKGCAFRRCLEVLRGDLEDTGTLVVMLSSWRSFETTPPHAACEVVVPCAE